MPMSFPDMESLIRMGEMLHFRKPYEGESERDYRNALADFDPDTVEAHEIRTGKGWDQWNESEQLTGLVHAFDKKKDASL